MIADVRHRIESVEHWELLALMVLTVTAVMTLYLVGLLLVRPFVPIESIGVYLLVGIGVAAVLVGFNYWLNMRYQRQRGRELRSEEAPDLHEAAERLAAEMDIEKPQLRVIDEEPPNAYAVGRRTDGIVFFNTAILETLDDEELEAVLAHELAHLEARDVVVMQVAENVRRLLRWGAMIFAVIMAYLAAMIAAAMSENQTAREQQRIARRRDKIIVAITGFVSVLVLVFSRALSRNREYIADLRAAETTGNPEAVTSALRKIDAAGDGGTAVPNDDAASLYILNDVEARLDRLFGTHPSTERRIDVVESDFETDDEPSRAYEAGSTLGSFTTFGLTAAPALIVLWGLVLLSVGLFDLSLGGGALEGVLAIAIVLSLLASLIAFPWAMLFGEGGTPLLGFVSVVLTVLFLFGGIVGDLAFGIPAGLVAFVGLMAVAGVQIQRVLTDWRATS